MNKKVIVAIIIIIAVTCVIVGTIYYSESTKTAPMKTVETKAFKFNTTPDDNWTFYKDHEDGYSYKNDEINQSKIRFYTDSMEKMDTVSQLDSIGWKKLSNDNLTSDVLLYESHFDNENPVTDSVHNYYSAFKPLSNGGYVHVSSMDLNRTITIVNAIESVNTGV